jgi:hypothetical protein
LSPIAFEEEDAEEEKDEEEKEDEEEEEEKEVARIDRCKDTFSGL